MHGDIMQPLGRKPSRWPNKVDHHIVGHKNWWEDDMCSENKAADRRDWKKIVEEEIDGFVNDKKYNNQFTFWP
jgi:hypothetical protein